MRPSDPRVSLRPITEDDLPFLRRVYVTSRDYEMAVVPWSEEQKLAFLEGQFAAQHAHYRQHFTKAEFWIVLVDGEPAGRLYLDRRAEEHRLVDVSLAPEHRGQGLGSALLRDVMADAAAAGKRVTIHVEIFNPAMRLYQRLGFRAIDDQGPYHLMEWVSDVATLERTAGEG